MVRLMFLHNDLNLVHIACAIIFLIRTLQNKSQYPILSSLLKEDLNASCKFLHFENVFILEIVLGRAWKFSGSGLLLCQIFGPGLNEACSNVKCSGFSLEVRAFWLIGLRVAYQFAMKIIQ